MGAGRRYFAIKAPELKRRPDPRRHPCRHFVHRCVAIFCALAHRGVEVPPSYNRVIHSFLSRSPPAAQRLRARAMPKRIARRYFVIRIDDPGNCSRMGLHDCGLNDCGLND
jgi:hypothetical protein